MEAGEADEEFIYETSPAAGGSTTSHYTAFVIQYCQKIRSQSVKVFSI